MESLRLPEHMQDDEIDIVYIFGAEPDEDENDDVDNDEEDSNSDSDDPDSPSDDDEDNEEPEEEETIESLKSKLEAAEEARRKAHRRMQRADRAKALANKRIAELENGDSAKELTAARQRITELEEQIANASGVDKTSLIREEFRDLTAGHWHNVKLAFSQLNLDDIEVDDDGNVNTEDLKDAISDLKKSHAYLLVSEQKTPSQRSGQHSGRRKQKSTKEDLVRKYPILAQRG